MLIRKNRRKRDWGVPFSITTTHFVIVTSLLSEWLVSDALRLSALPPVISAGDTFIVRIDSNFDTLQEEIFTAGAELRVLSSKRNELDKTITLNSATLTNTTNSSFLEVEFFTISSAEASRTDATVINVVPGTVLEMQLLSLKQTVSVALESSILIPVTTPPGQALHITVQDPFAFESGHSTIEVVVSVSCSILPPYNIAGRPSQGNELVQLSVSGTDIQFFTGSLMTFEQLGNLAPNAASNDGAVDLKGPAPPQNGGHCSGDSVTVLYSPVRSALRPSTAQATVESVSAVMPRATMRVEPSAVAVDSNQTIEITVEDESSCGLRDVEVSVSVQDNPPITSVRLTRVNVTNSTLPTFRATVSPISSLASDLAAASAPNAVRVDYGSVMVFRLKDRSGQVVAIRKSTVAQDGVLTLNPFVSGTYTNQDVSTVAPGEPIYIQLRDADVEVDAAGMVNVTVRSRGGSLTENVTLTQSGAVAGFFTGQFKPPGFVQVWRDAFLQVSYADSMDASGGPSQVVAEARVARIGTISCQGSESDPDTFAVGDTISITVVDPDLDQFSAGSDITGSGNAGDLLRPSVAALGVDGDLEVVVLTETSETSGTFTGEITTTLDAANHQGLLLTAAAGVARISYYDAHPESIIDCRMRLQSVGVVTTAAPSVLPGEELLVTVADADLNANPFVAESHEMLVLNGNGQNVTVQIKEDSIDSSTFVGSFFVSTSNSSVSLPFVYIGGVGDSILISYLDASPLGLRQPTLLPRVGRAGNVTALPTIVGDGTIISITVIDFDLNTDPAQAESYESLVSLSAEGSAEVTVAVYETAPDSSVFTGNTSAVAGAGSSTAVGVETLEGTESAAVQVLYADPTAGTVASVFELQMQRVGLLVVTQAGADDAKFGIGGNIVVTVTDGDLDTTIEPDVHDSLITFTVGVDFEQMSLTETGAHTGVFTGEIPTSSASTITVSDGVLSGISTGDEVTAGYADANPVQGTIVNIEAGYAGVITTDPVFVLSSTTTLAVTVVDPDLNTDSGSAEDYTSQEILWYRFENGDQTFVDVTETGANTNTFTGSLTLPSAPPRSPGSRITFTYLDPEVGNPLVGAVRSAINSNPVTLVMVFGTDGGDGSGNGPSVGAFALSARSEYCPESLKWAGLCGPTTACGETALCGATAASATGTEEFMLPAGSVLSITVWDADQNLQLLVPETVSVWASNSETDDSVPAFGSNSNPYCRDNDCFAATSRSGSEKIQTVRLLENGIDSGIFTGELWTRDSPYVNFQLPGAMHVSMGDVISLIYQDQPTTSGQSAVNLTRTVKITKSGNVGRMLTSASVVAGAVIVVDVYDPDLVGTSIPSSALQLQVVNKDTGRLKADVETPALQPVAGTAGLFRGSIDSIIEPQGTLSELCGATNFTQDGTVSCQLQVLPGDGFLTVATGDSIVVTYTDEAPFTPVSKTIEVTVPHVAVAELSPRFVEAGLPVSVTLTDLDLNIDSQSVEHAVGNISSGHQRVSVTLTETNEDSGVFTGILETLAAATAVPGAGPANALVGEQGQEILFRAFDEAPYPVDASFVARFESPFAIDLLPPKEKGTLSLAVTDPDVLRDENQMVSLTSRVRAGDSGPWVPVELFERSPLSAVFTGELALWNSSTMTAGDLGALFSGDTITAEYHSDFVAGRQAAASVAVQPSFKAEISTSPAQIVPGRPVVIRLDDEDQNVDPFVLDAVTVTVQSNRFPSRVFILTETGRNTGTFQQTFSTRSEGGDGTAVDNQLFAVLHDQVVVQYFDLAPLGTVVKLVEVSESAPLKIALAPTVLRYGGAMSVSVLDSVRNSDPKHVDSVSVMVQVNNGNGSLALHLLETGLDTDLFTGALLAGILQGLVGEEMQSIPATVGDVLTVSYDDSGIEIKTVKEIFGSTLGSTTIGNGAQFEYGSGLLFTTVSAGGRVSVTVEDADLNQCVTSPESATVQIVSSRSGIEQDVVVTETSVDSATFTGSIQTVTSADSLEDASVATLLVDPGALLQTVYVDEFPRAVTRSLGFVRISTDATLQVDPAPLRAGSKMTLYIMDTDLDTRNDARELSSVVITSVENGDEEHVVVTETGDTSGVFTGVMQTLQSVSAAVANSSFLSVTPGAELRISFMEPPMNEERVFFAMVQPSEIGEITVSSRTPIGEAIAITVVDADFNLSPDGVDQTIVELTRDGMTDPQLSIVVVEHGVNSGVFTAAVHADDVITSEPLRRLCTGDQTEGQECTSDLDCLTGRCNHWILSPTAQVLLEAGTTACLSYGDSHPDGTTTRSAFVQLFPRSSLEATPSLLVAGDSVALRLGDFLSDVSDSPDVASVTIVFADGIEFDSKIKLFETGANTAVFTGFLVTDANISPQALDASQGDKYTLVADAAFERGAIVNAPIQVATRGQILVDPEALRADGILSITVDDPDLLHLSTTSIPLQMTAGDRVRRIDLTASEEVEGRFTATVLLWTGAELPEQQTRQPFDFAFRGLSLFDHVVFSYFDMHPAMDVATSREVLASQKGSVTIARTFLEGSVIAVSVYDADQCVEISGKDSVLVTINSSSGDTEDMVLVEDDFNSCTFVGALPSVGAATVLQNDGILQVSASEEISVFYFDPSPYALSEAHASVIASTLGALSLDRTDLAPGTNATVTVIDPDVNSTEVTISLSWGGVAAGSYQLALQRIGDGEFRGAMAMRSDHEELQSHIIPETDEQLASQLKLPRLPDATQINMTYTDRAPLSNVSTTITTCSISMLEIRPATMGIGTSPQVILRDADVHFSNVTVSATNIESGESIELVLQMSMTGIYTGTLDILDSAAPAQAGGLRATKDSNIQVQANDDCPAGVSVIYGTTWNIGNITMTPAHLKSGAELLIQVDDLDLNNDASLQEQVAVICKGGDFSVDLLLDEVGPNSALFETRVHQWPSLKFSRPGADILCEYIDQAPNGKRMAKSRITESEIADLSLSPQWIGVGGQLHITILDLDLSLDPLVADADSSSVHASSDLDSKPVTVVETGPNTGEFTGAIVTDGSPRWGSPRGNGGLMVQPGSTVSVAYDERAPKQTRMLYASVDVSYVGEIVFVPEPIGIGSRVEVAVIDPDLKLYGNESSLRVNGLSNSLDLVLIQSMADPDIYEAEFYTLLQTALTPIPGPNELLVQQGQSITALYQDVGPHAEISLTTQAVDTRVGTMSASPFPALPGQILTFTLVDSDYFSSTVSAHTLVVEGPSIDVDFERNEIVGSVQVSETSAGSGVYTGVMFPLLQDDLYEKRQQESDMGAFRVRYGDVLTVTYDDALPLQKVRFRIKIADVGVLTSSPLATRGETLIRVRDLDLNVDPAVADTLWVTAEATRAADSKNVTLMESGFNTGEFTALLQTQPYSISPPSAVLAPVHVGDAVVVRYWDADPVGQTSYTLLVTSEYNGSLSVSAPRVLAGDLISITVDDADLNLSPYHLDFAVSVVTTTRPGEGTETIILTETSLNGTTFTGVLHTQFGSFNGEPDNGVMDVNGGDLLTIEYREAAPSRTWTEKVKISTAGFVTVNPSLVNTGGTLTITVNDFDLNTNEFSIQSTTCTVQSASGDVETVTVTEVSLDSSFFTGSLPTQTATAQVANVLSGAAEGTSIAVTYSDAFPAEQFVVTVPVASVGVLSISPTQISPDQPVSFTVTDPDLNFDVDALDNITIVASTLCSSQTLNGEGRTQCNFDAADFTVLGEVNVTLQETGPNTATFTGSVDTFSNASEPLPGALVTPSGSMVQLSYIDDNPTPVTERIERKRVTGIGALFALPSSLNEFGTITITLEDADLDLTDGLDTNCGVELLANCPAPVRVIGPSTNRAGEAVIGWVSTGLNILLIETAAHSGIFTGDMPTTSAIFSVVQSGIVPAAEEGVYITVVYEDAYPAGQRTSVVRIATVGVFDVPEILAADEVLMITLLDHDANNDPLQRETVTVLVQQNTNAPFAFESVTLVEQGVNSNVFVHALPTSTNSLAIPEGGIYAPSGSTIVLSYQDDFPTPNTTRVAEVYVSTVGEISLTCSDGGWDVCSTFKVVVLDVDLNTDSALQESHAGSLVMYNQRGQEAESLTLTELAVDSSSFEGTLTGLDTEVGDCGCGLCPDCIGTDCCVTAEDGTLFFSAGDVVQAVYVDSSPAAFIKHTRVVPSLGVVSFPSTTQIIGDELKVQLIDVDLSTSERPLITLQATRTSNADSELLYLQSSGTQGVFTAAIPTTASHTFSGSNGLLELDKNDVLSAVYQDVYPFFPASATLSIERGVEEYPQFRGVLEVSPFPAVLEDGSVQITLTDYDLDQNSFGIESDSDWSSRSSTVVKVDVCIPLLVNASLECDPIGSEQYITLLETATGILASGTFTGSIDIYSRADSPIGLAGAQAGYVVRVSYADYTTQATVSASIQVASKAIVAFDSTAPFKTAGGPLMVTLIDIEDTLPGTELRSRQVTINSLRQSVQLELTETALGTGYYTGGLRGSALSEESYSGMYRPNCPPHSQFLANLAVAHSLSVTYSDSSPEMIVSDTLVLTGETGSVFLSSQSIPFGPGDIIFVTVVDADLNANLYEPDAGISGVFRVFGYGWKCGDDFPTCSRVGMADGSTSFQNCTGFPRATHQCVHETDYEDVTLTENGRNSGVFTGVVDTSTDPSSRTALDGSLFCGNSILDTAILRAVYMDPSPAGNMNEAFIRGRSENVLTINGADNDQRHFSVGETLSVTLRDADGDTDPCTEEYVLVTFNTSSILASNDPEALNLTETGTSTGVFTATIQTASSAISQMNGVLEGLSKGSIVSAFYADPVSSDVLLVQTKGSHAASLDSTYGLMFPGGTLQITLIDEDLNTDDSNVGEMVEMLVTVSTTKDSETEVVTIHEQVSVSNPTGTFVGLLQTAEELQRGRQDSGLLHVMPGDLLTVTYSDFAPSAVRRLHVRVATLGTLVLAPSLPAIDQDLSITVNDIDRDLDIALPDQIDVTAYKQPNTHTKMATLTETGPSTGVFTGSVLLSSDAPSATPEVLGGCAAGDTVFVTYTDQLPLQDVLTVTSVYEVAKLSLSSPWIEAGLNISLTIVDGDMNQDPTTPERIASSSQMLWVTTDFPAPGDLEYVTAIETGPNTGEFTADIATSGNRLNAQIENNAIIEPFDPSYFATITYYDLAPREDRVVVSRSSTIGEVMASPTLIGADTPLSITVDDIDLNYDDGVADSAEVLVTTSKPGEGSELVSLFETGVSTGRFTGTLDTRRTALLGEQDDGSMYVLEGHTITIAYSDGSPVNATAPALVCRDDSIGIMVRDRCTNDASICTGGATDCYNPREFTVSVGHFGIISLDTGTVLASSVDSTTDIAADVLMLASSSVDVTVIDSDLNSDSTSVQNHETYILAAGASGGFTLDLEIIESGIDTKIFTGTVFTSSSVVAGALFVGSGAGQSTLATFTYNDPTGGSKVATARLQTQASVVLRSGGSTTTVRIGDPLTITAYDGDRDLSSTEADTIDVIVLSSTENMPLSDVGHEPLTLVESGVNTGTFTGIIPTAVGTVRRDGIIAVEMPSEPGCQCSEIGDCPSCTDPSGATCTCTTSYIRVRYNDPSPAGHRAETGIAVLFPGVVTIGTFLPWEGGHVDITVVDPDKNLQSGVQESAAVSLQALASQDATSHQNNTVILHETALSSGVFTASVLLCTACATNSTALNVSQHLTRYLVASYQDDSHERSDCSKTCNDIGQCEAACVNVPALRSAISEVSALGKLEAGLFQGAAENLFITVRDPDRNRADQFEQVNVTLSAFLAGTCISQTGDCGQGLALNETEISSGVFTGAVALHRVTAACTASTFNLPTLCTSLGTDAAITLSYADLYPAGTVSFTSLVVCDAVLSSPPVFVPGDSIQITVQDCDMDTSSLADTLQLTVTAKNETGHTIDAESIVLTETTLASGLSATFTGTLPTTSNSAFATADDGQLYATATARDGSAVLITYRDTNTSSSKQSRSALGVKACATASMTVSQTVREVQLPDSYFSTLAVVDITVIDGAQNMDRDVAETATVRAFTQIFSGTDQELVQLTETGVDSGEFTGKLGVDESRKMHSFDSTLAPMMVGQTATFQYRDGCSNASVVTTASCIDIGTINIDSPVSLLDGGIVHFIVHDADLNTNDSLSEPYAGLLSLAFDGDLETVTLTEDSTNSSTFTGQIAVSNSVVVPGDGLLFLDCEGEVRCNLTASYTDAQFGAVNSVFKTSTRGSVSLSSLGLAGSVLLSGQALTITVKDADFVNGTPVAVTTDSGDRETAVLTQSTTTSGVYTAVLSTLADSASLDFEDGMLSPLYEGSGILVSYADQAPNTHTANVSLVATSPGVLTVLPDPTLWSTLQTTPLLTLGLSRPSLNQNALQHETTTVGVASYSNATPAVVDRHLVTLNETGPASAVFTGVLAVSTNPVNRTALLLDESSHFEVWHELTGLEDATWARVQRRFARAATGPNFPIAPYVDPQNPRAGGLLQITIVDTDADQRWEQIETLEVTVSSSKIEEGVETVVLTEMVGNSTLLADGLPQGTFTGSLQTMDSKTASGAEDARLHTKPGDTITMTYLENQWSDGTAQTRTSQVLVGLGGTAGKIILTPSLVFENESLCLTVVDPDPFHSNAADRPVVVQLSRTLPNGTVSVHKLTLNSSSTISTEHHGCIATFTDQGPTPSVNQSAPATLVHAFRGQRISITYDDELPLTSVVAYAFISRRGVLVADPFILGINRLISVTVIDPDLNSNPTQIERGFIDVSSSWAGEGAETVELIETSVDSETFTARVRTVENTVQSPEQCVLEGGSGCVEPFAVDQALHVREGDLLTVLYRDVALGTAAVEPLNDIRAFVHAGVTGTVQMYGCIPPAFPVDEICSTIIHGGEPLKITVTDPDLALQPDLVENRVVAVSTSKDSEVEEVLLTETSSGSSVFTGLLDTCMGESYCTTRTGIVTSEDCRECRPNLEGRSNNGVLTVRHGDLLTVRYADAMPIADRTANVKVARVGVLRLNPASHTVPGTTVSITVIDDDVNIDPAAVDSTSVTAYSPVLGEPPQVVTLTESSIDSGHFTGSFSTCTDCISSVGIIPVDEGDLLSVIYSDAHIPSVEASASATVEIVLTVTYLVRLVAEPSIIDAGDSITVSVNNKDTRFVTDVITLTAVTSPSSTAEREMVTAYTVQATGLLSIVWDATSVSLDFQASDIDDFYVDGLLVLNSESRTIIQYDGETRRAYVDPVWDATALTADMPYLIERWGLYRAVLPTRKVSPGNTRSPIDGILDVQAGQEVIVSYRDQLPSNPQSVTILVANESSVDAYLQFSLGQPSLVVQVDDFDMDQDPTTEEVLTVVVTSPRGETETLLLKETAVNSAVFAAYLPIVYSDRFGVSNDGFLHGLPGDLISLQYSERRPAQLIRKTLQLGFAATLQIRQPNIPAGFPLHVTVVDGDLNWDPLNPDVMAGNIFLLSRGSGLLEDTESVVLVETGESTNTFTAAFPTALLQPADTAESFNAVLQTSLGAEITLQYDEAYPQGTRTITTTSQHLAEISFEFRLDPSVATDNSFLDITLLDYNLASAASVNCRVNASLDQEMLVLVSAGAATFTFTGSILVRSPETSSELPHLLLDWDEEVSLAYDDALPLETSVLDWRAPAPNFVFPSPMEGDVIASAPNCGVTVLLLAQDDNGFGVEMIPTRHMIQSDWRGVPLHDVGTSGSAGLIEGASLVYTSTSIAERLMPPEGIVALTGMQTATFTWIPSTRDVGKVFTQCMLTRNINQAGATRERCFRVHVERCNLCAAPGESLHTIAKELGTDWELLWSLNHQLESLDDLSSGGKLRTGMFYTATDDETVETIGNRFRVQLERLFAANPDAKETPLLPGQKVCISPQPDISDFCPAPEPSSIWEPIEEQYVPPDYWEYPHAWEAISYNDPRGLPDKQPNPLYPQLPAMA